MAWLAEKDSSLFHEPPGTTTPPPSGATPAVEWLYQAWDTLERPICPQSHGCKQKLPSTFKPALRPYQAKALEWMMEQEQSAPAALVPPRVRDALSVWTQCRAVSPVGEPVWYNPFNGALSTSPPPYPEVALKGGILAEGK
jgi:hypothetical protein